jgi:pimeloyl-ACP methyl ester carboxylesterase
VYLASWTVLPAAVAASRLGVLGALALLPYGAQTRIASAAIAILRLLRRASNFTGRTSGSGGSRGGGWHTLSPLLAVLGLLSRLFASLNSLSLRRGLTGTYDVLLRAISSAAVAAGAAADGKSAFTAAASFAASAAASASPLASASGARLSLLSRLAAAVPSVSVPLTRLLLALLPTRRTAAALAAAAVWLLRAWSIIEVGFYCYYLHRRSALNRRSIPDELPPTPALRRAHIRRLLNNVMASGRCPILFIRAWYRGAEFRDIRHENLREWVSGSFFNRGVDECTEDEVLELDDTIGYIQRATGLAACRGYSSQVSCIRFTMDPLNSLHRPLVMYGVLQGTGLLFGRPLYATLGFKCIQGPFFRYWFRPSPHRSASQRDAEAAGLRRRRLPSTSVITVLPPDWAGADAAISAAAAATARARASGDDDDDSVAVSDDSAVDAAASAAAAGLWDRIGREHTAYGTAGSLPGALPGSAASSSGTPSAGTGSGSASGSGFGFGSGSEPGATRARDPVEDAEARDGAVVFCHGIGIGSWTYMPLFAQLIERYPNKDIFVPEFDYVSMRLSEYVPSARQTASGIRSMLSHHGHERAILVGHSYGTFVVSYCLRFAPRIAEFAVLIDPVCFLIHQVDGPFQFLFAPPTCAQSRLIHFIAQTELGVVHTLARRLWWYQAILWEDCLPSGSSVVLSARDTIVPSAAVRHYLQHSAHRVRVLWLERMAHAGFVANPVALNQILDCLAPFAPLPTGVTPVARPPRVPCAPPCPASDTTFDPSLLSPAAAAAPMPAHAHAHAHASVPASSSNGAGAPLQLPHSTSHDGADGYHYGRVDTVSLEDLPAELARVGAGARREKDRVAARAAFSALTVTTGGATTRTGAGARVVAGHAENSVAAAAGAAAAANNSAAAAADGDSSITDLESLSPPAPASAAASASALPVDAPAPPAPAPVPSPSPTAALAASIAAAGAHWPGDVSEFMARSRATAAAVAPGSADCAHAGAGALLLPRASSAREAGLMGPVPAAAAAAVAQAAADSPSSPSSPSPSPSPSLQHHSHQQPQMPTPAPVPAASPEPGCGGSTVLRVPASIPASVSGTGASVPATVEHDATQPHRAAVLIGPMPQDRYARPGAGACAAEAADTLVAAGGGGARAGAAAAVAAAAATQTARSPTSTPSSAATPATVIVDGVRRFASSGARVCPATCVSACCTRTYFAPFVPTRLPGGLAGAAGHAHEHAIAAANAAAAASAVAAGDTAAADSAPLAYPLYGTDAAAAAAAAAAARAGNAGSLRSFSRGHSLAPGGPSLVPPTAAYGQGHGHGHGRNHDHNHAHRHGRSAPAVASAEEGKDERPAAAVPAAAAAAAAPVVSLVSVPVPAVGAAGGGWERNYVSTVKQATFAPPAVDEHGNESRCGPTPKPLVLRSLPSPYHPSVGALDAGAAAAVGAGATAEAEKKAGPSLHDL